MKNCKDYAMKINFKGNCVKSSSQTKLLGMIIDDSLSWKAKKEHIISKINTAYSFILTIQPIMSTEIQLCFGIMFWGN
jgi:hypothetical protein